MAATWEIKRQGIIIAEHSILLAAEEDFWTLTATALLIGEKADYTLDTHSCYGVSPPDELPSLPPWVRDILSKHGLY